MFDFSLLSGWNSYCRLVWWVSLAQIRFFIHLLFCSCVYLNSQHPRVPLNISVLQRNSLSSFPCMVFTALLCASNDNVLSPGGCGLLVGLTILLWNACCFFPMSEFRNSQKRTVLCVSVLLAFRQFGMHTYLFVNKVCSASSGTRLRVPHQECGLPS